MTKEEIRIDLLAFADDDSDILFESNGDIMFYKNGTENICRLVTNEEGNSMIEYLGERFTYKTFIAKHLANLDLFARKIVEKRKGIKEFVDSPAILQTGQKATHGKALELLQSECDNFLEFGSKINFITADAGQGKSILLKQFQVLQAERYIKGESKYLFWHVDLQGRELVRLGEAIMFDLGELRLPGLYYSSIMNLIQKRFIILAIDGFDELAAEIGGVKAVSSLSNFVKEMAGQGTLIAASRRTFFDVHDYLKRTSLIKNEVPYDINFNELKLENWGKAEVLDYFEKKSFDEPEKIYGAILSEVHEANHPVLTRPFLLAKLGAAIEGDAKKVSRFFSRESKGRESVSYMVELFTKREVDKWKGVDSKTGEPYLSFEQHIQLLAAIAKEMWDAKKDFITVEEIEVSIVLLLDEWKIEEGLRQIIVRIAGSHAFLIPVDSSKMNRRKFDHEEFKHYFLARYLADLLDSAIETGDFAGLKRFLYIDQLPDSVAMYCFNYVKELNTNVRKIVKAFKAMIDAEWKPTYLQLNIGTLFPFMLDKIDFSTPIHLDAKVNYSSLIFENKQLRNITFEHGTFTNISFRDTRLENVCFKNCEFSEIKIDTSSRNKFQHVSFEISNVVSLFLMHEGEIVEVAYAPQRIGDLLEQNDIKVVDGKGSPPAEIKLNEKSEFKKTLTKFVLKFNKMRIQYEKSILIGKYLGKDTNLVIDKIIPLCLSHNVIEAVETKQAGKACGKAYRLAVDMAELLKQDGAKDNHPLTEFWNEVNNK